HLDQALPVAVLRLRGGGQRDGNSGGEKQLHPHLGRSSHPCVRASSRPVRSDYEALRQPGKPLVAPAGSWLLRGETIAMGVNMGRRTLKALAGTGAALAVLMASPATAAECGELAQMALPHGKVTS